MYIHKIQYIAYDTLILMININNIGKYFNIYFKLYFYYKHIQCIKNSFFSVCFKIFFL
jgi:hypothetical protein